MTWFNRARNTFKNMRLGGASANKANKLVKEQFGRGFTGQQIARINRPIERKFRELKSFTERNPGRKIPNRLAVKTSFKSVLNKRFAVRFTIQFGTGKLSSQTFQYNNLLSYKEIIRDIHEKIDKDIYFERWKLFETPKSYDRVDYDTGFEIVNFQIQEYTNTIK